MANLKLENIYKTFDGKQVLKNINMEIIEGELVSLLGPSGCGKTTLLKIITGLLAPDGGKIFFNGEDYTEVDSNKRNAVIVFQDYGLFPHMTIVENIEFGLKVRNANKSERRKKVEEMLSLMQLEDKGKNYPFELSGGQKQRVALARALVVKPRVLLLDEPFSNLDTNLKETMRDFVMDLQKKLGFTTILVTHDKEEAFMMSHKVAVILKGELQQFGTPSEIYNKPLTRELSDFVGEANYVEGKVANGVFKSILGDFKVVADDIESASLMIRYDQILLTREKSEVRCKIIDKKYAGKTSLYKVIVNNEIVLTLNSNDNIFQVGHSAYLRITNGENNIYK
ncbi:ABC transporter ATP-binding protein [Clostridium sp.]|uniref:ABC transporter ATP-binding protein n=1 Tax=Clostridium sp. TaxID=1506 RepID=UPI002FC88E51